MKLYEQTLRIALWLVNGLLNQIVHHLGFCKKTQVDQLYTSSTPMTLVRNTNNQNPSQDGCIQLEMERIGPVVMELHVQCPQEFGFQHKCLEEPVAQRPYRCTSMGHKGPIEVEMELISLVAVEFQGPQKFGCLKEMPRQANDHALHISVLLAKTQPFI